MLKRLLCSFLIISASFANTTEAKIDEAEYAAAQGKVDEALEILRPLAAKNNPRALHFLAAIQLFGKPPSPQEGMENLKKSVELGYAPAMDTMAGLYLHGEYVEEDHQKALALYTKAAELGYGPSQFNCGIMHLRGKKIPKNLEEAYVYLALAALNDKDLDKLTQDAAKFRDEATGPLTPPQRVSAAQKINRLTLIRWKSF